MPVKIKKKDYSQKNGLAHDQDFCKIRRRDKINYSKVCLSYDRDKEGGCCSKGVVKGVCILGSSAEAWPKPQEKSEKSGYKIDESRKW